MNTDINILLFKYIEGLTTTAETIKIEKLLSENAEYREMVDKLKPALDVMRPFWPKREPCPNSWNLVQYLNGDLKNKEMILKIENHIDSCRYCKSIKDSFDDYQKTPEQEREIKARSLSQDARNALADLKKRY